LTSDIFSSYALKSILIGMEELSGNTEFLEDIVVCFATVHDISQYWIANMSTVYTDLMHTTGKYLYLDERDLTQITVVDGLQCFDHGDSFDSFFMIDKGLTLTHPLTKSLKQRSINCLIFGFSCHDGKIVLFYSLVTSSDELVEMFECLIVFGSNENARRILI